MQFQKYSKIENSYRDKAVEACKALGIKEWISTEKCDGSNFNMLVDESMRVSVASRNQLLTPTIGGHYNFHGCDDVVARYKDKMREISHILGFPVQIVGEMYGQGIQKRINYGEKDFLVFDIMLPDETFLPWDTVVEVCAEVGVKTAPELARGTLEDMLGISPEFTSKLCNDASEGLVIKPLISTELLPNGSRPILKVKSAAFSERKGKKEKPMQENLYTEEDVQVFQKLSTYICEERLGNVLSKLGELKGKDFGKVTGLLVQDAKEDFEKDCGEISKEQWTVVKRDVSILAMEVVREDWANIIDN